MNYEILMTVVVSGPTKERDRYLNAFQDVYQIEKTEVSLHAFTMRESYLLACWETLPKETPKQTSARLWKQYTGGLHPEHLSNGSIALIFNYIGYEHPAELGDVIQSQSADHPELYFDVTWYDLHTGKTMNLLLIAGKMALYGNISNGGANHMKPLRMTELSNRI